jgi:hypothetical protein
VHVLHRRRRGRRDGVAELCLAAAAALAVRVEQQDLVLCIVVLFCWCDGGEGW